MHEKPSRYPHSPSTQENCLGITSHAEALQRAASQSNNPEPQTPNPCPTPAPRPTAPYGGVVAGGVQGCRVQTHGMAGSQPAAHGIKLKQKHTQPNSGVAGLERGYLCRGSKTESREDLKSISAALCVDRRIPSTRRLDLKCPHTLSNLSSANPGLIMQIWHQRANKITST